MEWFPSDLGHSQAGCVISLRAEIAAKIVAHCALVTGCLDGEDSQGRAKVGLLPAAEVAQRANAIAAALITEWEAAGWIRPTVLSPEEDWALAGRLKRISTSEEYKRLSEELTARK